MMLYTFEVSNNGYFFCCSKCEFYINFDVTGTDYERTLMSASACMAGLFPPSDEQTWNQHLTWQPIPIHTVPIEMDYILHARTSCSRYNWAMQKYLESPEYTAIIAKHQQLFQYLEEKTESRVQSLDDVQTIYNTLWIQKLKNKTSDKFREF